MNFTEMNRKWNEEKIAIKNSIKSTIDANTLISEMNTLTGENMSLNDAISHKAKINIFA